MMIQVPAAHGPGMVLGEATVLGGVRKMFLGEVGLFGFMSFKTVLNQSLVRLQCVTWCVLVVLLA